MTNILWVGVDFDPDGAFGEPSVQHVKILKIWQEFVGIPNTTTVFPRGGMIIEQSVPNLPTIIDIFDSHGLRIGFGIRVATIEEGREKLSGTDLWLRSKGIERRANVCAWSPDERPVTILFP